MTARCTPSGGTRSTVISPSRTGSRATAPGSQCARENLTPRIRSSIPWISTASSRSGVSTSCAPWSAVVFSPFQRWTTVRRFSCFQKVLCTHMGALTSIG